MVLESEAEVKARAVVLPFFDMRLRFTLVDISITKPNLDSVFGLRIRIKDPVKKRKENITVEKIPL
jgi:hypothetical protein